MRSGLLHPERFFVVIPCYNCSEYIGPCLDSLLEQSFNKWTALIADDASTDDTSDVVRRYMERDPRICLRTGEKRSWLMGNTLNALRSLSLHPSDVVAILDGDDYIQPECLKRVWEKHCQGYELIYTDEAIQGQDYSIGAPIIHGVPVRKQTWRFSQLRSFKAYLFFLMDDQDFRDGKGKYFRSAGDLALYLPMAELAGPEKICFIPEKLYYYRVHEHCNFKVLRREQLDNNWDIRTRPPKDRQCEFFDYIVSVDDLCKSDIDSLAKRIRREYPSPFSVRIDHMISPEEEDSWRAYHGLWVEQGVFLNGVPEG